MTVWLYNASALDIGQFVAPESVDLVVTSPPYYGLRTYEVPDLEFSDGWVGQLGAEPHPDMFIQHIGDIFDGVRLALKDTGILFLNIGDSAATSGGSGSEEYAKRHKQFGKVIAPGTRQRPRSAPRGFKNKDVLGIPYRCAIELQRRGWIWRETIIWVKTYGMPEPPRDRPTRVFEPIFMFAKAQKYYWNKGVKCTNVWNMPTSRYREAHFATFPEELPNFCMKMGCPEGGVVLDPFAGAGTTLIVAGKTMRDGIGIELSPQYCDLIRKRMHDECGMFADFVMYGGGDD